MRLYTLPSTYQVRWRGFARDQLATTTEVLDRILSLDIGSRPSWTTSNITEHQ